MKTLLDKLNPHRQIILTEMRAIGYSQVYLAEPMRSASDGAYFFSGSKRGRCIAFASVCG